MVSVGTPTGLTTSVFLVIYISLSFYFFCILHEGGSNQSFGIKYISSLSFMLDLNGPFHPHSDIDWGLLKEEVHLFTFVYAHPVHLHIHRDSGFSPPPTPPQGEQRSPANSHFAPGILLPPPLSIAVLL